MSKKVLVILGHPRKESLANSLAEEYIKGAKEAGAEVDYVVLPEEKFDLNLHDEYAKLEDVEDGEWVKEQQSKVTWAEHIVFIYPIWWGAMPAILKAYTERVLMAGFAFKYTSKYSVAKLLKGKTARMIQTCGAPWWAAKILFGGLTYYYPGELALKNVTLKFCGIRPKGVTTLHGITKHTAENKIERYKNIAYNLGKNLA